MAKKQWKMPKWMEPYLPTIIGGNTRDWVEEIMNDDGTNSNVVVNAPRALVCVSIKAQVDLLTRLHEKDMLVSIT